VFVNHVLYYPKPGQEQALADLLGRTLPVGARATLMSRLWGTAPELRRIAWYESLAAFEAANVIGDQTGLASEFVPLVASPPAAELDQVIVEAPEGPPPNYVMRLTYEPAQGEAAELRPLLEQRMRAFNANGEGRVILSMRFSGGPAAFYTSTLFQSLAELEQTRARAQQNPAAREVLAAMTPLLERPVASQDIYRVVARSER
jgi:hypothetical protein